MMRNQTNPPYLNTNNNHQLISRQQTYVLDRKLVTIHSNDRDVNKWPFPNHFEIQLPEAITNVQSMRLVEACMPSNYYTFSNDIQNTKLQFAFDNVNINWSTSIFPAIYGILASAPAFDITIDEGFYRPEQIADEIANKMNKAVTQYLEDNGISYTYDKFVVTNNEVGMKMYFGNTIDSFILHFDVRMPYTLNQCEQPNAWERYTQWGLGFNLGFDKESYSSSESNDALTLDYNNQPASSWLSPSTSPVSNSVFFIEAPLVYKLLGENTIYVELEKYNSMDELNPYSEQTNSLYNNDYNGVVNAAFAKIPITIIPYGQVFDSRNGFLQNLSHYDPPLERVQKLKFKFRTHSGSLIDFQDFPFNFTVEFNCLRNEVGRQYEIRVPALYSL